MRLFFNLRWYTIDPINDYATKQDVKDLSKSIEDKIGTAVGGLSATVGDLSATVDLKITKAVDDLSATVDAKITKAVDDLSEIIAGFARQVDQRFNKIETEMIDLKLSFDRFQNTLDGFLSRIDHYEIEMAARDHQFNRLLAWARKVSDKTGIPLENL